MVLALIGTAATRPIPLDTRSKEIMDGTKWVAANVGHLPTTLDELSALPPGYRTVVETHPTVSVDQREAFWRSQLESFVKPEAELTPIQRKIRASLEKPLNAAQLAFIRMTLDSLHNGIGSGADSAQRKAFARKVCADTKKLFSRAQGSRIFAALGPIPPTTRRIKEASLIDGFSTSVLALTVRLGLRMRPPGYCVCNVDAWCDCPGASACVYDQPQGICETRLTGCGCFHLSDCNGSLCYE